jgi:hypothetical protein
MKVHKVTHYTTEQVNELVAQEAAKGLGVSTQTAYKCEPTPTGIAVVIFDAPPPDPKVGQA